MSDQANDGGTPTAQAWLFGFMAGVVILALLMATYIIGFNRGQDEAPGQEAGAGAAQEQPAQPAPKTAEAPGAGLFAETCGGCHTLAAAGTSGAVGPNLDQLAPSEEQVSLAIANGGAGSGQMPTGLLSGNEARQVAAFVASAAGG